MTSLPRDPRTASPPDHDGGPVLMLDAASPIAAPPAAPAPDVPAHLERRLAQLTGELEQARADADAFSYSISHEIREPLRAIQGLARVFREDHGADLGADAQELLRRMEAAGQRAEVLVKSVLEYTRLGRQPLGLQAVPVRRALDEALAQIEDDLARSGAALQVEGPLPEVLAHRPTLAQVLANLLANATKFVAPGQRPDILVRSEPRDGWARIHVHDRGIGLPSGQLDRVFEPFVRLHAADLYPGTGIGLAFVRRALERMGGRVGAESELEAGSDFWIELREEAR